MRHKGIIFDMDGTLWDSAENVAKSWNKAIADYGYVFSNGKDNGCTGIHYLS